jgi:hypothetical protein
LSSVEVGRIAAVHATLHDIAVPATAEVAINAGPSVIDRVLGWWPELGALSPSRRSVPSMSRSTKRHFTGDPPQHSGWARLRERG